MNITTTYSNDYEWPHVKNFPIPPQTFQMTQQLPQNNEEFICNEPLHENQVRHEWKSTSQSDGYEWSRLGPMRLLLEPKLYAVNTALDVNPDKPIQCNSIKNWTKTFEELSSPREPSMPGYDTLRIIHENRLKSTYQVDYDHLVEYPYIDYDKEINVKDKSPEVKCRVPVKLPYIGGHEIPGRPPRSTAFDQPSDKSASGQNVASRTNTTASQPPDSKDYQDSKATNVITKMPLGVSKMQRRKNLKTIKKSNRKFEQMVPGNAAKQQHQFADPWTSEYSDAISFTADEIMRNKLHCTTKKCREGK
ncbi:uncharacterized protein LOC135170179 [Diachasmimorpha longicaudata]|uniref:uncharacterized protein LOC135170179 n=1 Tax=Diachasmimorpha longicaudata TaxID=58733 RepID=UPI0030B905ED